MNRIEIDTSNPVACCVSMLVAVACELCCLPIMDAMCEGCKQMCCDTDEGNATDKAPLKSALKAPDLQEMGREEETVYLSMPGPD